MVPRKLRFLFICAMAKKKDDIQKELKKLGARIKALRKAKGYANYEQFAYDHNIARAQFGRYENGQNMRFSSLCKVAKAFDMTVKEFFNEGFDEEE